VKRVPTDRLRGEFLIERADGRTNSDSRFFVLDYAHDPHARAALEVYADEIEVDDPGLAADLRSVLSYKAATAS
jgi:hypothetical protein